MNDESKATKPARERRTFCVYYYEDELPRLREKAKDLGISLSKLHRREMLKLIGREV